MFYIHQSLIWKIIEVLLVMAQRTSCFLCLFKDYNEAGISFYDDEVCKGTIEGIGGRANENEVELISLRLISKEPEREIKRLFNAIRNKLKKDPTIGVGVQSGSSRYPKFFYQKSLTDNKVFKFDLNNDKLPVIKPLQEMLKPNRSLEILERKRYELLSVIGENILLHALQLPYILNFLTK